MAGAFDEENEGPSVSRQIKNMRTEQKSTQKRQTVKKIKHTRLIMLLEQLLNFNRNLLKMAVFGTRRLPHMIIMPLKYMVTLRRNFSSEPRFTKIEYSKSYSTEIFAHLPMLYTEISVC